MQDSLSREEGPCALRTPVELAQPRARQPRRCRARANGCHRSARGHFRPSQSQPLRSHSFPSPHPTGTLGTTEADQAPNQSELSSKKAEFPRGLRQPFKNHTPVNLTFKYEKEFLAVVKTEGLQVQPEKQCAAWPIMATLDTLFPLEGCLCFRISSASIARELSKIQIPSASSFTPLGLGHRF